MAIHWSCILDLVAAFLFSHSQKALVPLLQTCPHFGPWLTKVLDHVDNTLRVTAGCQGAWAVGSDFLRPNRKWSSTPSEFAVFGPARLVPGRAAGHTADSGDVLLAFALGSFLRNVQRPSRGRRNGRARGIHRLSPRLLGATDNHALRRSTPKRRRRCGLCSCTQKGSRTKKGSKRTHIFMSHPGSPQPCYDHPGFDAGFGAPFLPSTGRPAWYR